MSKVVPDFFLQLATTQLFSYRRCHKHLVSWGQWRTLSLWSPTVHRSSPSHEPVCSTNRSRTLQPIRGQGWGFQLWRGGARCSVLFLFRIAGTTLILKPKLAKQFMSLNHTALCLSSEIENQMPTVFDAMRDCSICVHLPAWTPILPKPEPMQCSSAVSPIY